MAATWVPHLRLAWGGTLGSTTPEIWTNTVKWNLVGGVPPTRDQLVTACDAVEAPLKAWFQGQQTGISNQAVISWAKLNWILADGKQRDQDTVQNDFAPPVRGGVSGSAPPFYQTQAITLRTRVSRGRGHSGRIFPPMVSFAAEDGGPYATSVSVSQQASSFITCLRALRDAMGLSWLDAGPGVPDPAVFSVGSNTGTVRAPLMTPIISAVCDRVPDVQHRRTNRVPRLEGTTTLLDP